VSVALNNKHVNVRARVTELSKELHNLAPKTLKNSVKKGIKVSKMFEVLENDDSTAPLLKELTQVIDAYLEKHRGLKEDDVKDILASWVGGAVKNQRKVVNRA